MTILYNLITIVLCLALIFGGMYYIAWKYPLVDLDEDE